MWLCQIPSSVDEALSLILRGQEPAYLTIWEGLTLNQRKTTKAAARLKGRLLTSKETIQAFGLESASNVAKSLSALCSKGILRKEHDGYVFEDVLFSRWVERVQKYSAEKVLSQARTFVTEIKTAIT